MSAIVAPSAPAVRTRTASDRTFFLSVAVAAALLIFIGFSRSYYLKIAFPLAPPLSLLVHVHGAVFTAWVLYFVLQTTLIAVHRPALHRRLGIFGAALGTAVIVLGLAVAFMAMRLNHGAPPFDPETQFLVALVDIVTFAVFFVAGWLQRGERAAHQRLMLLAVVAGMLSAPLGRIVGYGVPHPVVGVVNLGFLLAGPVYDVITRRRIHPVYVYGCLFALVTFPPVRFLVGASPWWHRVAHTLAGVPTAGPAHTTAGMLGPRRTRPDDRSITRVRHARTWLAGAPLALTVAIRPAPASAGGVAPSARDSAPPPRVTPAVRALAGCYRLHPASAGRPGHSLAGLGLGQPGLTLPEVVHLDPVAQRTTVRAPDFRAGPDVTAAHELPSVPGRRPVPPDSLVVDWFDGFAGTTLRLRRAGDAWRGVARYAEDTGPYDARPTDVVATRVACPR